ncbi:17956_t:CDS:2 [Entrophospora sp. SA101]|nr:17956_t:CDS:2 [Entrophospora sp. SA101]
MTAETLLFEANNNYNSRNERFSLKLFVSTTNLAVAVINEETSDIVLVNDVVLDHDHRLWRNIKTAFYKESLSEFSDEVEDDR